MEYVLSYVPIVRARVKLNKFDVFVIILPLKELAMYSLTRLSTLSIKNFILDNNDFSFVTAVPR